MLLCLPPPCISIIYLYLGDFFSQKNPLRVGEDQKGPKTFALTIVVQSPFLFLFSLFHMSGDITTSLQTKPLKTRSLFSSSSFFSPLSSVISLRKTTILFFHLPPQYLLFFVTPISPFILLFLVKSTKKNYYNEGEWVLQPSFFFLFFSAQNPTPLYGSFVYPLT